MYRWNNQATLNLRGAKRGPARWPITVPTTGLTSQVVSSLPDSFNIKICTFCFIWFLLILKYYCS